tara:strand:+ start:504 stop:2096 length:1593 start_codon:yes stop_codon:yes gene_type:complete
MKTKISFNNLYMNNILKLIYDIKYMRKLRLKNINNDDNDIIIYENLKQINNEDSIISFIFFIRDVKNVIKEKEIFYKCFLWYYDNYEEKALQIIRKNLIPKYGYYKDYLKILEKVYLNKRYIKLETSIYKVIISTILNDIEILNNNNNISYLSKWLPNEGKYFDKKINFISKFCKIFYKEIVGDNILVKKNKYQRKKSWNFAKNQYRNLLKPLKKKLNITETKMSNNEWDTIDFNKVPTKCMNINKNAFLNHNSKVKHPYSYYLYNGNKSKNNNRIICRNNYLKYNNNKLFETNFSYFKYINNLISDKLNKFEIEMIDNYINNLLESKQYLDKLNNSIPIISYVNNINNHINNLKHQIVNSIIISNFLDEPLKNCIIIYDSIIDDINIIKLNQKTFSKKFLFLFSIISSYLIKIVDANEKLIQFSKNNNLIKIPSLLFLSNYSFENIYLNPIDTTRLWDIRKKTINNKWKENLLIMPKIYYWSLNIKYKCMYNYDDYLRLLNGNNNFIINSYLNNYKKLTYKNDLNIYLL